MYLQVFFSLNNFKWESKLLVNPDPEQNQDFDDQKLSLQWNVGSRLWVNADPDSDPRFWWPNGEEVYRKKCYIFLFSGHLKDSQATREASSHPKKTSDTSKHEISRLFFLLFLSHCCLKGSGSNPDQDPDPILIQIQIQKTDYDLDKFLQAATRYACNFTSCHSLRMQFYKLPLVTHAILQAATRYACN